MILYRPLYIDINTVSVNVLSFIHIFSKIRRFNFRMPLCMGNRPALLGLRSFPVPHLDPYIISIFTHRLFLKLNKMSVIKPDVFLTQWLLVHLSSSCEIETPLGCKVTYFKWKCQWISELNMDAKNFWQTNFYFIDTEIVWPIMASHQSCVYIALAVSIHFTSRLSARIVRKLQIYFMRYTFHLHHIINRISRSKPSHEVSPYF